MWDQLNAHWNYFFSNCVKFRASLTHLKNFQAALKSPILTHFEKKNTWKNMSMSLNMLEDVA